MVAASFVTVETSPLPGPAGGAATSGLEAAGQAGGAEDVAAGGGQDAPAWRQGLDDNTALEDQISPLFWASARLSIQTGQRRSARGPVQGERGSWAGSRSSANHR